jgi:GNAT superfamily N-acetyltransferase
MTVLQRETMDQVLGEIEPLLQMHFAEIAHYQDIPLDPDMGIYRAIEKDGGLRIFTARSEGVLVGYAIFFVRHALHYRGSRQGVQDILFVAPDKRGSTIGPRLISYCDNALRDEGVQVVYHHVKAAHDFSSLLKRLGYQLVDHIYARRLDHGRDSSSNR